MLEETKTRLDSHEFLARAGTGKVLLSLRKGQVVFNQGEIADRIFYVHSGGIKLTITSERGREAVLGLILGGHFFGEGCLNGQKLRICTARAFETSEIASINLEALRAVLRDDPSFVALFMHHLLARNIRLEEDLVDHLFNSSEKRLARLLLLMADFGDDGSPQAIIHSKITQETLAEMIGTTRSRVSFFMNRFRKLGFITYDGSIKVNRSLLNAVIDNQPHRDAG